MFNALHFPIPKFSDICYYLFLLNDFFIFSYGCSMSIHHINPDHKENLLSHGNEIEPVNSHKGRRGVTTDEAHTVIKNSSNIGQRALQNPTPATNKGLTPIKATRPSLPEYVFSDDQNFEIFDDEIMDTASISMMKFLNLRMKGVNLKNLNQNLDALDFEIQSWIHVSVKKLEKDYDDWKDDFVANLDFKKKISELSIFQSQ